MKALHQASLGGVRKRPQIVSLSMFNRGFAAAPLAGKPSLAPSPGLASSRIDKRMPFT